MARAQRGQTVLTDTLWTRLLELARGPHKALVAVPYFGANGAKLLPLQKGSRLVVNCSEATVKAGQVNPSELLKLHRRGVEIHHSPHLHAKVFVFGSRAVVGSANVSENSKSNLIEAAIETSARAVVAECRRFVRSLLGDELGSESLGKLARLYRPSKEAPKDDSGAPPRPAKQSVAWLAGLEFESWDEVVTEEARRAKRKASDLVQDKSRYRIDQFRWSGREVKDWNAGQRVFQITEGPRGAQQVWPPGRVLDVRKFTRGRAPTCIVCAEVPKFKRSKPLSSVRKLTGNPKVLRGKIARRRLDRQDLLEKLSALWNPR